MRDKNIEHLGQVRYAILEDTGKVSVFYFSDEEVKPGLPILPDDYKSRNAEITKAGLYACAKCGHTKEMQPNELTHCEICEHTEWILAIDRKRIT